MYNETITYYAKNPGNKNALKHFDVSHYEDNSICGDDVVVYLKIEDNAVTDYGFEGDTSIITTACGAIFGESIIGMDLNKILKLDGGYIEELVGMPISPRRKQASVLCLLTTRNAIHKYLDDGRKDNFEDLI